MEPVATYPKPRTSIKSPENKVYPYLLRHLKVERPNQVWCTDITYIPMRRGFAYLTLDHGLAQSRGFVVADFKHA